MCKLKKIFTELSDVIDKAYKYVGIAFLVFLTAASFIQVISRYVFNNSLSWTEELARYAFIWANMLGAAIAVKHGHHASVDLLPNKLHGKKRAVQQLLVTALTTFGAGLLLVEGLKMTASIYATGQLSAAVRLPMYLIYMSVPVGGFGMIIHCVTFLFEEIKNLKGGA